MPEYYRLGNKNTNLVRSKMFPANISVPMKMIVCEEENADKLWKTSV